MFLLIVHNAKIRSRILMHKIVLLLTMFVLSWNSLPLTDATVVSASPQQASSSLIVNLFQDKDVNASFTTGEPGFSGIIVRLYDSFGAAASPCATKTSNASGEIIFTPTDTEACSGEQLRLEVDTSTYPPGMVIGPVNLVDDDSSPATPTYMDSATDASAITQIVDLTSPVEVNIGMVDPDSYTCSAENAYAMTTCYVNGDSQPVDSPSHNMDALVGFPYTASGAAFPGTVMTYVEPDHLATMGQIGSTWGLAWSQQTEQVYVGSFLKRHVALGPLGLDGIYRVDFSTGTAVVESWLELDDTLGIDIGQSLVPDILTRDLPTTLNGPSYDELVYPLIATVGLGDVDLVSDEALDPGRLSSDGWIDREFLLAVNLYSKDILVIDPASSQLIMTYNIPAPAPACTNGTHRPWAVDYINGAMYVGLVCDGSDESVDVKNSRAVNSNLEAIVYRYDLTADLGAATIPAAPTVVPETVLRFALDYEKGSVWTRTNDRCLDESNWHPWRDDVPPSSLSGRREKCWPIPILADIDFSDEGNMLLAFMDRSTHQWGWLNYSIDRSDSRLYSNMSGGDLLMACLDGNGDFILENNGACGNLASANPTNRNEGPGGREFFYGDSWPHESSNGHLETANNGIAVLPGSNEVIAAGMDPYGNAYYSAGGINWYSTTDGRPRTPGYMLYASQGSNSPVDIIGTAGKSGGLGDVDLICPQLPITIGDYVWLDSDGDGIQDPDEIPLAGVTVYLQLPTGTIISTSTDANGRYYFDASRNQNYVIAFDTSTSTTVLLNGFSPGDLIPTVSNSSENQNDSDIDGTLTVSGIELPSLSVTTDKGGTSDHTNDAGFVIPSYDLALIKTLAPGQESSVYQGSNVDYIITVKNQGDLNSGEFTVTEQMPVGMSYISGSGTDWTCGAPNGQTVTCTYMGDLVFQATTELNLTLGLDDASQGPFRNWSEISEDSSAVYNTTDKDSTPDTNTGNDNGSGIGTLPNDPVVDTDDIDYSGLDDEDDNDFADLTAVPFVSIGDTIWHDENNDGILTSSETGIGGVVVELLDEDGNLVDTTTTDNDGFYIFDELLPGSYQVRIPEPPVQYPLSSTSTDRADNGENDDDNGEQVGGYGAFVISPVIKLQPNLEPANDGDADTNSDLTIDFGFWKPNTAIALQKTVYGSHNAGSSCSGVEQEVGVQGDLVTYCFLVTNTGNVYLDDIMLTDPDLGIERSDMTLLRGSEPLAPGGSMSFFYETSITRDLLNIASTSGNPTDSDGNDILNLPNPTDEDNAEVLQFAPDIRLDKTVYFSHNSGADCPGRELVNGVINDAITYCFIVTNVGDTYLDSIIVVDPDLGIDRSGMTLISGSEPLAPEASIIFYYEGTLARDLVNTANTAGNPTDENGDDIPNMPEPTDNDDAEVRVSAPDIQLEKTVYFGHSNGVGCPGGELVSGVQGDRVTYCFFVTNTGDTYLDAIALIDPDLDIDRGNMTLLNGSEPLAPGTSMTFYYEELMAGNLVNTATTSGNPTDENGQDIPNLNDPTDKNDAAVEQLGPGIRLDKTVYPGHDGGAGCPGEELVFGIQNSAVTYCFVVTNVGDTYLSSITLDDPDLSISRNNMTLLNGSEPLAPGASMTFYYNGGISQDLINEATTTGNPTEQNGNDIPNLPHVGDENEAQVEMTAPAIRLDKTVYSSHNNGANCPGAELETGVVDTLVTYCFIVTNTGDTYLSNIELTDPALGIDHSAITLIDGQEPLAPGDTMTFYHNGTITTDLINTAGVVGNPTEQNGNDIPNLPEAVDSNNAEVKLVSPSILLDKTIYFGHDGGANCPGTNLTTGVNNDPVTYCFVITNTGDTYLNAITLVDSDLGINRSNMTLLSGSEPLAPNAQLIFFYETQLVRALINVAETSGNPTDANGNDLPNTPNPADLDDAEVRKFAPGIVLQKTVYPDHNAGQFCPGSELVNGILEGNVTYCFVVTNTGDTYLEDVQLNDAMLGITRADMTLLSGNEPLAPGNSLVFYYEDTITISLVNIASTTANPADENGVDIPNLGDVGDEDQAEVRLYAPKVHLQKTVYVGHDSGSSCPGEETVAGLGLTKVTYCFVVTNIGDTYLNEIDIADQPLNITDQNLTLLSGTQPLAPGNQMVYYYETVRIGNLLNMAIVVANPTDENGTELPNLPYQIEQDTATVVISPVAAIGDTVWLDVNADGAQDPDENGLAEVVVTLYDGDGNVVDTTTTDEQGNYLFNNLNPGIYSVGFELPGELYIFSPMDNVLAGNEADSDVDPITGSTIQIELTSGATDLSWDAGIFTPPILIVGKRPNLSIVQPSGIIVYTIEYANIGLGSATGIVIEETLPEYTSFAPEKSSTGWQCEERTTSTQPVCQYEIESLAGMESGRLDLSFAVQADRVLPEGIDRVVNTVRIDDDGTHGVLPSSQNTETKIVNVVRPTALESSEEPDMYAGMYDIYVTSDNSIDQSEIFIPVISRHLFKDLESQSMTIGEYWTIQGCYFLTEALRGRSELMQRPNMSEWYSYCSVVSGQGEE